MSDFQVSVALGGGVTGFSGVYNVLDYGAVKDGATDDLSAIQAAIDACISGGGGRVHFPAGTYLVSGEIDLTGVDVVSNADAFGITISGDARGTLVVTSQTTGQLWNMDYNSTGDIQVKMRDMSFRNNPSGGAVCFKIGKMSRYSIFENIRMYQFKEGIRFMRSMWGMSFKDLYIRACTEEAIIVDSSTIGSGVINEIKFVGGYIDDNGTSVDDGDSYLPVIRLYNSREWTFSGVVIEGNVGGGVLITGACENVTFNNCRLEETLVHSGVGGHIHGIEPNCRNTVFNQCELSYDANGPSGGKSYALMNAQTGATTTFNQCQFVESSNSGTSDMMGSTPDEGHVVFNQCLNGRYDGNYTALFSNFTIQDATADDTTPSVLDLRSLNLVANTGATAITQLDDAYAGQIVTLVGTSNTNSATIADSGNFELTAAWTATDGHTLTLLAATATSWIEIARTDTTT